MADLRPSSALSVRRIPAPARRPAVGTVREAIEASRTRLLGPVAAWQRRNAREHFERSLHDMEKWERGSLSMLGQLYVTLVRSDGSMDDLGLVSCRVVTTAGVNFMVDAFQGLTNLADLKYHGVGTGTTAESTTQTALVSELTTQYSTSNTRPTGTTGEVSGTANAYETTATVTVSAAVALTEHGVFSRAATGGGTLLDRSVYSAVNLASAESMQCTYQLTLPNGG